MYDRPPEAAAPAPTLRRVWLPALAILAAVRVAIPLLVLAAAGRDLRVFPRYDYEPFPGDAYGFHATARELISTAAGPPGVVAVAVVAAGAAVTLRLREAWWRVVAASIMCSIAASAVVAASEPAGAAVVGWPLVWAALLLPFRLLGLADANVAFAVALPLLLAANAATVVATAYLGLRATGSRAAGLAAAALYAFWPLVVRPLAGERAWDNSQWLADVGLTLYNEPLSTALVAVALALLLAPRPGSLALAVSGMLLGLATAVKLSNGLVAALVALLVVARLGPRRAVPLVAAGLPFALLVGVYWPKGYPVIPNVPELSPVYALESWSRSSVFDPVTLLVLAPLALVGLFARRWAAVLLGGTVAVVALFHACLENTRDHPRFLYVALPALFALEAAGGWLALRKGRIGFDKAWL